MNVFKGIVDFFSGGAVSTIVDAVQEYFPPDMSEEDKLKLEMKLKEIEHKRQIDIQKLVNEAEQEFNKRIADHEGTAKDLKHFGIIGKFIVFLRGVQRPFWGFFAAYIDFMWFMSAEEYTDRQEQALLMITGMVLLFLFGERGIINVLPIVERFMKAKK